MNKSESKKEAWKAINDSYESIDYNICDDIHKQFEFMRKKVLAYKFHTKDGKNEAIILLNKGYDRDKIFYDSGTKRICENCNQECLATLFCEYCVRNYLKANFPNWTSGNVDIDNLIQKCQLQTLRPSTVVEWIPYNNLQNIEYSTKGGRSEIYTADWIIGRYYEWDSKKQQLERFGKHNVILKKLKNAENANLECPEEIKSHLTISNISIRTVKSYGLTKDPDGNYILVLSKMDTNLREYLREYLHNNRLTWKEKIKIAADIIQALNNIHNCNKFIHNDLHSGNILYSKRHQQFHISDFEFSRPMDMDKRSEKIYGNLPYIAPEVIAEKSTTFASDIYSIGILMWEISSRQPPFINYEDDYDLATNIINGIRPKIVRGTPLEYENLMKQCWDADPLKRPDVQTLLKKIREIKPGVNTSLELTKTGLETNYTNTRLFTSKVHQFKNLPEPRNATEGEQEEFHSKPYDFHIPDNIDDFDNPN